MMASMAQTVPKIIRNLKDNSKVSLQCGALTYIRSNAEKLNTTEALKEEEYSEICRLVMDAISSVDQNTRNEAIKALHVVLEHFKNHNLKFFESALHANRKKRLKIFQFLETVGDDTIFATAQDPMTLNFFNDCLRNVQTNTMEWLLPSACSDNLEMLVQAECRCLSDDQELEELTVDSAIALLCRLYKIASVGTSYESIQRFDTLVMDKIVTLAYMGHKRQRPQALKLLELAISTDLGKHIKTRYSDVWARYKNDLQGPYSTRMALLVKACELDWSNQWAISIRLLGTDLHRGATLINNLLSVEERAFKSTDTNVRRQAFVSWKLLVDNFSLDPKELATARRIKLLCVPLTAKNSKSELIALTKLEVWWYLIQKLYPNITKFAEPVITQFLNFCFGPLGDTPLLSTKVDVIASPGKRFYKTKVVAIDALLQFIVLDQHERKTLAPILEQRLSNPINDELFKECHKAFLHSVGEAVVIIDQLNDSELTHREDIIRVLLTNLMRYVKSTSAESKIAVYNELILVVTELQNRVLTITCVNDFVRDIVVPELSSAASDLTTSQNTILFDFASKIITPTMLKSVKKKHCETLKGLLLHAVKTQGQFRSDTLQFVGKIIEELETISTDENGFADCFELWFTCSEIAYKYALTENVNEGTLNVPKFKNIEAIIHFPFAHMYSTSSIQAQNIANSWKDLYKQFECKADTIVQVKPNEIFDNTSTMIQECLVKNEKSYRIAVHCLDALLSTINYKEMLAKNEIPTIVRLVADLTTIALHEGQPAEADCALRALSSLLITVYGHCPEKALGYLKETRETIQLMLNIDAEDILIKEVSSTWETIVSILRGLGSLVDSDFLESYRDIILTATRHSNVEIVAQSEAVIGMKDNLKETAKYVLVELEREVKKSMKLKSDKASDRSMKQVRMTGSFMNRKIPSPRPAVGKLLKEREKLTPLPPEPDSQDYVVIKSDVKLDVSRLTEHQKESFKRRRDDIPAMYNDLSQSSSQDTQDLQQWFDGKGKQTKTIVALVDKKAAVAVAVNDNVPTIEKKLEEPSTAREEKLSQHAAPPSNLVATAKNLQEISNPVSSTALSSLKTGVHFPNDPTTLTETSRVIDKPMVKETTENLESIKTRTFCNPLTDHSYTGTPDTLDPESPSNENSVDIVPKKLNFESRDEYPEDDKSVDRELRGLPSRATNAARASLKAKEARDYKRQKREEIKSRLTTSSREESTEGKQTRGVGRPRGITIKSSQLVNNAERGAKRKAASDSDSEANERSKRLRGKSSRSPSDTSTEDTPIVAPTDKRTESEMSRLRIDMVFDGPLPPRRRSKANTEQPSNDIHGKRNHSPEIKNKRGKNIDTRVNTDNTQRRSLRGTDKEVGLSNSDSLKLKRRRRSKLSIVQDNSVSQTIVDDDETPKDSPVAAVEILMECAEEIPKIVDTAKDTQSPPQPTPQPTSIVENRVADVIIDAEQSVKDDDEVIQSSQDDSSGITGGNRKSITSMLKLVKSNIIAEDINVVIDSANCPIKELHARASSPINPAKDSTADRTDVMEKNELPDGKGSHNESDDSDETFLDISAIRAQPVEDPSTEDTVKRVPDESKTNGTSASPKVLETLFNFSSPKNPSKRFIKPKGFTTQGRAAHMIGLVTKLAVLEKDCEIEKNNADEEAIGKKNKFKDNENERGKKDRTIMYRDNERIASPGGGSRQEKIFNNMKAADYAASPPGKLFANLKNNGEKISPKMEKVDGYATGLDSDVSSARDDEEDITQSSYEKDELPILEWSSANPPSLTASPSASILKRNRPILTDPEVDTTPNKSLRKRVSFADPPVSKEMGYEVASGGSPLKTSKFTSRSLFGGKNSPLRIKQQSRFKMIQLDAEKTDKEEEEREETEDSRVPSSGQIEMDCERYNALLVKIADDLEDTAEFRSGEEASLETSDTDRVHEIDDKIIKSIVGSKNSNADDIETQDDLFNSSDEKHTSPKLLTNRCSHDVSKEKVFSIITDSSTIDSLKLNVTDDSVLGSITNLVRDYDNRLECLEDTVDARNITSLNSSANSDEIFCEKSARMICQIPDGISQMDTLPVTDSISTSLPITQDSQDSGQSNKMVLAQPQLLNSIDAIYPSLVDCQIPIDGTILGSLANPLWLKNLSKYLSTRGILTVGDLARLSEREIDRIPVKGNPRVDFVIKVLRNFEEKLPTSVAKFSSPNNNDDTNADYLALVSSKDNSIGENTEDYELPTLDVSAVTLTTLETLNDSVSVEDLDPHVRHTVRRTSTHITNVLGNTQTVSEISTINLISESELGTTVSVGTSTETLPKPPSKSVASQMAFEELLDEIDVKLVLESAVKRCSAETLLAQYKLKMGHMPETELGKETMRMLNLDAKIPSREETLKSACRACGLSKVLVRLPDIFNNEKKFMVKLLNAYRDKLKVTDCLDILNFEDVKSEICRRCSCSELTDMLLSVLKRENNDDASVSGLKAILRTMPMDMIIDNTVANTELIPSSVVLDMGLKNNDVDIVTSAIENSYPEIAEKIVDRKMTPESIISRIENNFIANDKLLSIVEVISTKLSSQELLDACYAALRAKLNSDPTMSSH